MPSVRPPEECELDEDRLLRLAKQEDLDPRAKEVYKQLAEVCYQEDSFQNQHLEKWFVNDLSYRNKFGVRWLLKLPPITKRDQMERSW